MQNKTILQLKGNTDKYKLQTLISGSTSFIMYFLGFSLLYAFYHNGQRAKKLVGNPFYSGSGDYEYSVLFVAIFVIIIGYYTGLYFTKSFNLYLKSKNTSLQINQNVIIGIANKNKFEINVSDISLVDIQEFSYKTHANGKPKTLDKSFAMKISFKTSKYLILRTRDGNTYYIDTLPSLDYVKTTISAEIKSNNNN